MPLPVIAVVGRPNVGKSTLVNRLAQAQDAIVHEARGVTRDRSYHRADWNGRDFMLVDTGGIEMGTDDAFGVSIRRQALIAAEESDVVVFLVDGKSGIAAGDEDVAQTLLRSEHPVFLAVNKMDTPDDDLAIHEFWSLGLGQPWAVSALHGHGTGDLLDALVEALPQEQPDEDEDEAEIRVAIIGKPNSGKSSLYNKLLGIERSIVSEVAGTTRDAIDTVLEREERRYRLVDTAGLRRKGRIDTSVEYYSFVRAMRAIDRADVALLLVDASEGVTDGDQRVARFAEERGCATVVLLNKWDLVTDEETRDEVLYQVNERLGFIGYAPVLRISALTGRSVGKVLDAVDAVYASYTRLIATSAVNRLLTQIRESGHTISRHGVSLKVRYGTQTRTSPPGFTFFANHPKLADENFRRFMENRMREAFDLTGTPVEIRFRQRD